MAKKKQRKRAARPKRRKQQAAPERKRTWFVCACGNRITTNYFPLRCQESTCGKVWVDRETSVEEGWSLRPNTNLVNAVCAKFFDNLPPGRGLKVQVVSAVPSNEREENLKRLKAKYGENGERIWDERGRLVSRLSSESGKRGGGGGSSRGRGEETGQKATELRRQGLNWSQVGKEMGMSASYVRNAAYRVCGDKDPKDVPN